MAQRGPTGQERITRNIERFFARFPAAQLDYESYCQLFGGCSAWRWAITCQGMVGRAPGRWVWQRGVLRTLSGLVSACLEGLHVWLAFPRCYYLHTQWPSEPIKSSNKTTTETPAAERWLPVLQELGVGSVPRWLWRLLAQLPAKQVQQNLEAVRQHRQKCLQRQPTYNVLGAIRRALVDNWQPQADGPAGDDFLAWFERMRKLGKVAGSSRTPEGIQVWDRDGTLLGYWPDVRFVVK